MNLYKEWLIVKETEKNAVERRREIEDKLFGEVLRMPADFEGSKTIDHDGYRIKVTARMNRKIDGDRLQEVAVENGLMDHLSDLFRWKPDINMAAWKQADESITKPLEEAITTKPGRPSFVIETLDQTTKPAS